MGRISRHLEFWTCAGGQLCAGQSARDGLEDCSAASSEQESGVQVYRARLQPLPGAPCYFLLSSRFFQTSFYLETLAHQDFTFRASFNFSWGLVAWARATAPLLANLFPRQATSRQEARDPSAAVSKVDYDHPEVALTLIHSLLCWPLPPRPPCWECSLQGEVVIDYLFFLPPASYSAGSASTSSS